MRPDEFVYLVPRLISSVTMTPPRAAGFSPRGRPRLGAPGKPAAQMVARLMKHGAVLGVRIISVRDYCHSGIRRKFSRPGSMALAWVVGERAIQVGRASEGQVGYNAAGCEVSGPVGVCCHGGIDSTERTSL